ncbi:MAG: peptidoglycan DD-metalloendopeptidase family protein [Bacteroidales bacterium]|nr:peptidoglycan DD-metalloendopeptidase family protein [Bacteroidales bacterium]
MKRWKVIIVFMVIMMGIVCAYPQIKKKSELENNRKKTIEEIELTSKLIKDTQAKSKESTHELNLVNHKIKMQNALIKNIEEEIEFVDKQINENNNRISEIENNQEKIKRNYARSIYMTYKNRQKENLLLYVLASENMNQAYKRFRYMQIINLYRRRQINMLKELKGNLDEENRILEERKKEKIELQNQNQRQKDILAKEKGKKKVLVSSLQKKERELRKELEKKKQIARELEREIERIIQEERRKSAKGNIYATLTKEDKLISDEFGKNYGRLPWPTMQGIIVGKFGEQDHPTIKGIKIRNDGIYIATIKNAEVRSIFKGVVTKVFTIPGANYTVIIRHGNFYTLYHNLNNVRVSAGREVDTKEVIGLVSNDPERNESILHFQVWKETERNDPELWLSR